MIPKQKWGEIIKDFYEKELPYVIPRDIDIPIESPINRAISIIGPRRTGKTYEMFYLIKKITKKYQKQQVLYVNLERADLGSINYSDLVIMLEVFYEIYPDNKQKKVWLFLDEIQNVSNWEKFVRTCLDQGIKVFLSGSSSKLLSKEIATSMAGRNLSYIILPFSFKEFLKAKKIEIKRFYSSSETAKISNFLENYFNYGGYPETIVYEQEREKILMDIFNTAIYKDVIERSKIRNIKVMKVLIKALISSKEFSINKFYNFLKSQGMKVGKNVLYNYFGYLNDAFFVFPLHKFSFSYKKAEQSIPKIYFIDNGLLKTNGVDDKGRLMENLVFIELMRRNLEIAYYQFANGEVDFVIKQRKKIKQLIQVCYNVDSFMTKERELKSLIKASKELKCKDLLVITLDVESEEKFKNKKIKFIPLWKWLLTS